MVPNLAADDGKSPLIPHIMEYSLLMHTRYFLLLIMVGVMVGFVTSHLRHCNPTNSPESQIAALLFSARPPDTRASNSKAPCRQ